MRNHPITGVGFETEPCWVERRSCRRLRQDGTVLFNIFNSDQPPRVGEIRNYCEHGLYFETTRFVRPGTPLYLRLLLGPTIRCHQNAVACCRSISLAEVRWCRVLGDTENSGFGIGVKFYE